VCSFSYAVPAWLKIRIIQAALHRPNDSGVNASDFSPQCAYDKVIIANLTMNETHATAQFLPSLRSTSSPCNGNYRLPLR